VRHFMKIIVFIIFFFGNNSFGQDHNQLRLFNNLPEWKDTIHIKASIDSFWNEYPDSVTDSLIARVRARNYIIIFRLKKSENLNQLYLETYNYFGSQISQLLVCERKKVNLCILYRNFFIDHNWIGIYGTSNVQHCKNCCDDQRDRFIMNRQIEDDGQILIVY
jgi:hypothetical protein